MRTLTPMTLKFDTDSRMSKKHRRIVLLVMGNRSMGSFFHKSKFVKS
jgi:hypothetical protein